LPELPAVIEQAQKQKVASQRYSFSGAGVYSIVAVNRTEAVMRDALVAPAPGAQSPRSLPLFSGQDL
jgi:hypothetical protein